MVRPNLRYDVEEVANAAIDSKRFDVMMLAYHFGMWPSFGHILEKAKQKGAARMALKGMAKGPWPKGMAKEQRQYPKCNPPRSSFA